MPADRLDLYLGPDMRAEVDRLTAEYGSRAEVVRRALHLLRVQQSGYRDEVARAVAQLAEALKPDGRYDPEDDPRQDEAVSHLAAVLGSVAAAQGVRQALAGLVAQLEIGA